MSAGPFQILIIMLVVLVLFGRGRISAVMGDFGQGVKSFRRNLADEEPSVGPAHIDPRGPTRLAAVEAPTDQPRR